MNEHEITIIESIYQAQLTKSELNVLLTILKMKLKGKIQSNTAIANEAGLAQPNLQRALKNLLDKSVIKETTMGLSVNEFETWGIVRKRHSFKRLSEITNILCQHYHQEVEQLEDDTASAIKAGENRDFDKFDDLSNKYEYEEDCMYWLEWADAVDEFEDHFELIEALEDSLLMNELNGNIRLCTERYNKIVDQYRQAMEIEI